MPVALRLCLDGDRGPPNRCGHVSCRTVLVILIWLMVSNSPSWIVVGTEPDVVNNWRLIGRVANSLRPQLYGLRTTIDSHGVHIKWILNTGSFNNCFIQIDDEPDGLHVNRVSPDQLFLPTAKSTATLDLRFTLEAICQTSQGEAKLPIQLWLRDSMLGVTPSAPPKLYLTPIPDRWADGIQFYRLQWLRRPASGSLGEVVVLVYNSTHVLQHTVTTDHVNIGGLGPNSQYVFCMVPMEQMFHVHGWRCHTQGVTQAIPAHTVFPVSVQNLQLVSSGYRWIQIAWDAPARTPYGRLIPRAYLIVLSWGAQSGAAQCQAQVLFVEAPWSEYEDKQNRRALSITVRGEIQKRSCHVTASWQRVQLLGLWPDWEDYDDSGLDELGPIGDFTVTLDHLAEKPDQYDIEVWPVVNSGQSTPSRITAFTTNDDQDCNLQLTRGTQSHLTVFSWRAPAALLLDQITDEDVPNTRFHVQIELIGRPDRKWNETCFVVGCQQNAKESQLTFLTQPSGSPQRMLCDRLDVPLDKARSKYEVQVPCLLPCKVFQVRIALVLANSSNPNDICQRRLIRSGQVLQLKPELMVVSLAQNALLVQLPHEQPSTYDMCASIGYAASLKPADRDNSDVVGLLAAEELFDPYQSVGESPSPWVLVPNRIEGGSRVKVALQNFAPGTGSDVLLESRIQPDQCRLDCIWSRKKPQRSTWNPLASPYPGIYSSAISPTSSSTSVVNGIPLGKCMKLTSSSELRPHLCQIPTALNHTGHLYCGVKNEWKTCAIPHCEEMARIRCVSDVAMEVGLTWISVEWNAPSDLTFISDEFARDRIAGYVILLQSSPLKYYGTECLEAIEVPMDEEQAGFVSPPAEPDFVAILLSACPPRTRVAAGTPKFPMRVYFRELTHNTSYQIVVTPYNSQRRLGSSWVGQNRTAPAPPCTPTDVRIKDVQPTSMTVKWTSPRGKACGVPTLVSVNYGQGHYNHTLGEEDNTEIFIAPLRACQYYCIEIQLLNQAGACSPPPKLCQETDRAVFTNPPTLQSGKPVLQNGMSQCMVEESVFGEWRLSCDLQARLIYEEKCRVQYNVKYCVYETQQCSYFTASDPELRIEPRLQPGLVYVLAVQATAPNYTELYDVGPSFSSQNQFRSGWSPTLELFTGTRRFHMTNLKVHVQQPTSHLSQTGSYFPTCIPSGTTTQQPLVLHSDQQLCIQLDWELKGPTSGLFGIVVLVFVQEETSSNQSVRQHPTTITVVDPSSQTTVTERCVRLFWVYCEDCLYPHSEKNVHNTVYRELHQLLQKCTTDSKQPASESADGPLYKATIQHNRKLTKSWLDQVEGYRFKLGESEVRFVGSLSTDPAAAPMNRAAAWTKRYVERVLRSASSSQGSEVPRRGTVRVYSANAGSLTRLAEKTWQLHVPEPTFARMSSTGLAFLIVGIIIALIVLTAVIFLFILNTKRRNRMRHSAIQRADYSEVFEEAHVLPLEAMQPIVPPKLSKYRLRQPDPISVHELVVWLEKHAQTNYAAIREEFKWLRVHSLRQEQAKRFTHHVGQRPENRLRNKYRNLVPFDHNYVRLAKPWCLSDLNHRDASPAPNATLKSNGSTHTPSPVPSQRTGCNLKDGEQAADVTELPSDTSTPDLGPDQFVPSDYTNASLVPGRAPGIAYCLVGADRLPRTYIAAQAPVEHTRALFWQMIWDHGVKLIVLLTRVRENGKEKCAVYWPGTSGTDSANDMKKVKRTVRFGQLSISLKDEHTTKTYVRRRFLVRRTNGPTGEERAITQLHMMQWSDFSAPSKEHFNALLYAYWAERRCCGNLEAPVLIHCSAGIGRTGTFICLDQLCQQVRYYLQPDFEPIFQSSTQTNATDEPVYANLKNHLDASGARNSDHVGLDGDTNNVSAPTRASKSMTTSDSESRDDALPNSWQTLLPAVWGSGTRPWSLGRRRRFGLGRKKSHCVDIYRTVLWLRSHRSYMVQSEDQYLFIYQYVSHFIQQINDTEPIYENI